MREPAKFFLIMVFIFIISYSTVSLALVSTIKNINKTTFVLSLLGAGIFIVVLVSLELLIIYFVLYKRFKKINVTLTEEGIIYNNSKGEIRIPYENIQYLKFPSIKYVGGWVKIIHTNGNIKLTVVLENLGDMLNILRETLDKRNMSSVYDKKKMFKFFKTAKYSDQSWERIYEIIKLFIIFMLINLGVTFIFSGYITEPSVIILLLIWGILGPFIPYIISEIILGIKLAKGSLKDSFSVPKRDKNFENKLYRLLFGIYIIIYFILLIIVRTVDRFV